MPMTAPPGRNAFGDPRTGIVTPWDMNHSEEQGAASVRTIANVQPSIGRWKTVRAIRQQSSSDALLYKLAGLVPTDAQHRLFLHFMNLSLSQSIYFFHAAGQVFEGFLSDYEPQKQYAIRGPRGEQYIYKYSLQIDVLKEIV